MRSVIFIASLIACSVVCAQNPPVTPDPRSPATPSEAQTPVGASAELKATPGNGVSGTLTLKPAQEGVHMTGTIRGLMPTSQHGFHVHEKGDCSAPDASSAGAHYNPAGQPHGNPAATARHLGDMPNIQSDAKGVAKVDMNISGVTLRTGQANDIVGKAIVVHEKADDYKTQPAGNSGNRIACAVIK